MRVAIQGFAVCVAIGLGACAGREPRPLDAAHAPAPAAAPKKPAAKPKSKPKTTEKPSTGGWKPKVGDNKPKPAPLE
jgi:hypothetical protein